jgi:hypothetical protein
MSDWFETLDGTYAKVWECLRDSALSRGQVAFATIGPNTTPEVRTVVLRNASEPMMEIYTDLQSDKVISLQTQPIASILLWDADLALQIRLTADVSILSGEAVKDRWASVPDRSKFSYGVKPSPGQPIPDSVTYTKQPDPNAFAVLLCRATQIDAVYLGEAHRRAAFSQDSDWRGKWLAP